MWEDNRLTPYIYTLPELSLVGGETREMIFHLYTESGKVFNAMGAKASIALVSSTNRTGAPVMQKAMSVRADENGLESILAVTLEAADTVGLYGKYIYQISIRDLSGEVEIPNQGLIHIASNIDRGFLAV